MKLGLEERVVIVTGGSSGIGLAVARAFAREGARVVITARRSEPLQRAAESLRSVSTHEVVAIESNTTIQASVDQLMQTVVARLGRIDVLVNCAANPAGLPSNRIDDLDDAALLDALNTKVVGYARCCKAVAPIMRRQGWGRIINVGGLTAREPESLGGMRNAAICHMSKAIADQLGPDGITVNTVHPGIIKTEHLMRVFAAEAEQRGRSLTDVEASYVADTPTRRFVEMDEIGEVAIFLASSAAASITGETLGVDGGVTRTIHL